MSIYIRKPFPIRNAIPDDERTNVESGLFHQFGLRPTRRNLLIGVSIICSANFDDGNTPSFLTLADYTPSRFLRIASPRV